MQEDTIALIDSLLKRNRGEGLQLPMDQARLGADGQPQNVPYAILEKEKDYADELKAKYDA